MRIATLTLCLALSTAAYPATFLKIDGIGKELEIAGFQLAGNTLSFTKKIDLTSPALLLAAATGKHIKSAVLADGGEPDVRVYTLEDILVTGIRQRAGSRTTEDVTFTFAKITIESTGSAQPSGLRGTVSSRISASTGQSVSIFMKAASINGSSTDPAHVNEMVTNSLAWGIRNTSGGKAQFQPVEVQKALDAASDPLLYYSQSGKHIPEVKLTLRQQGADFYFYRLQDVVVSDYSRTGSGETFKLQYAVIEVEFKGPQSAGTVGAPLKAGWNVKANQKV